MLAAALLGVLALTGSSGALWWSDLAPRAGQPYVAISYTGTDTFGCGGSIGQRSVRTTTHMLNDTTVCVLHIPKGTVGKKLMVGYTLSGQTGQQLHVAHGVVKPKVIRR